MNKKIEKIEKNVEKLNSIDEKNYRKLKVSLKRIEFWAKKALKSIERSD